MISIEQASKHYGEISAVAGVSLVLPAAGVTAIIGPNGAGKSTLLSLVARLVPLSAGRIEIEEPCVPAAPGERLAGRPAILRREAPDEQRLTVRDLVALGRRAACGGPPTHEDLVHVESALACLDLEELAGHRLAELSGGQRRRAFLAMLIAEDAGTVLLDEPLSGLDPIQASAVMKLVRRLAHELGRTVVVALHDVNVASCYADHIVGMRNGRVRRQGPPAEVVTSEALRAIYGRPSRSGRSTCPASAPRRICLPYA